MSTFAMKVHDFFDSHKASEQDQLAASLLEFAVRAEMRGLGIDRETAIKSLRRALKSIPPVQQTK